jgi:hypothetical protein
MSIVRMVKQGQDAMKDGKRVRIRFTGQIDWIETTDINLVGTTSASGTSIHHIEATVGGPKPATVLIAPDHLVAVAIDDK